MRICIKTLSVLELNPQDGSMEQLWILMAGQMENRNHTVMTIAPLLIRTEVENGKTHTNVQRIG